MNAPPAAVTLGESLALFAQSEPGVLRSGTGFGFRIGGAESNVAIGLARLGVPVCWMGRLGRDPFGDEVIRAMRGEGVDVVAVRDAERATGLMVKDRRTPLHQRISYYRSGSAGAALTAADLDDAIIERAQVLHVTGITLAISDSAAAAVEHAVLVARAAGTRVSFDINYRSRLWSPAAAKATITRLLPSVDLLFAGVDEATMTVGDVGDSGDEAALARRLQSMGPAEVVLKLGDRGALAVAGDQTASAPAVAVPVVDSVGAGDAFVAGFLAASLGPAALTDRLGTGCAAGAFACTSAGDWEGSPNHEDLRLMRVLEPVTR